MAAYEFIVCNDPGRTLQVREKSLKEVDPDDQPSVLGIVVGVTGDVTCNCSGRIMKRTNKKFPTMESDYHCDMCGKNITLVWD